MKHIHVITPDVEAVELQKMVSDILKINDSRKDFYITHAFVDQGPTSVENYVDEAVAVPGVLKKAIQAENNQVDGIIINCMADPGLRAVREAVSVPVFGLAENAMHIAAMLGQRFGVIDILDSTRSMIMDQAIRYGLEGRYGSFRSIDVPVLAIEDDPVFTAERLIEAGVSAVTQDHVDVLILGCGTLLGPGLMMEEEFKKRGLSIPIINPLPLAINVLEAVIQTGLKHSKKAYPKPGNRTYENLMAI